MKSTLVYKVVGNMKNNANIKDVPGINEDNRDNANTGVLQEILDNRVFKQPLQLKNTCTISVQLNLPRLSTFLWCLGQPQ